MKNWVKYYTLTLIVLGMGSAEYLLNNSEESPQEAMLTEIGTISSPEEVNLEISKTAEKAVENIKLEETVPIVNISAPAENIIEVTAPEKEETEVAPEKQEEVARPEKAETPEIIEKEPEIEEKSPEIEEGKPEKVEEIPENKEEKPEEIKAGWFTKDGKDYYRLQSGKILKDAEIDGYYVGEDGALVKDEITNKYITDKDGKILKNQSITFGETTYNLDKDGYIVSKVTTPKMKDYKDQTDLSKPHAVIGGIYANIQDSTAVTYSSDNMVYRYTPMTNYYVAERSSAVGTAMGKLQVGNVVTIQGTNYKVKERKTGLTWNDTDAVLNYLSSSPYKIALQTCDSSYSYIIILKLALA